MSSKKLFVISYTKSTGEVSHEIVLVITLLCNVTGITLARMLSYKFAESSRKVFLKNKSEGFLLKRIGDLVFCGDVEHTT